jgi:hypothetical protein
MIGLLLVLTGSGMSWRSISSGTVFAAHHAVVEPTALKEEGGETMAASPGCFVLRPADGLLRGYRCDRFARCHLVVAFFCWIRFANAK